MKVYCIVGIKTFFFFRSPNLFGCYGYWNNTNCDKMMKIPRFSNLKYETTNQKEKNLFYMERYNMCHYLMKNVFGPFNLSYDVRKITLGIKLLIFS